MSDSTARCIGPMLPLATGSVSNCTAGKQRWQGEGATAGAGSVMRGLPTWRHAAHAGTANNKCRLQCRYDQRWL